MSAAPARAATDLLRQTLALFAAVALLLALALPACPQTPGLAAAFQKMSGDGFDDIEKGIAELAATAAPEALIALQAYQGARLLTSKSTGRAFIQGNPLIDAATGKPAADAPADLAAARVNNRLRRAVEAALGVMTLLSPDPAKRLLAAEAAFKARDAGALPALEQAISREADTRVKRAFSEARAATLLMMPGAAEAVKLEAVSVLAARGGQDALAVLRLPQAGEQPAAARAAIERATGAIEQRLQLINAAQNVWYGISLGSVLLLAAIGLAITFGVMGVINMAHGEMVMIGAYVTFAVQEVIRAQAPELFGWSLPIAVPLAFLAAGAVGVAIERGVIRFLYGRPLETLLATFGVSLFLQQAVRTWFGPTNREVGAPSYMSGSFDLISGFPVTYGRLWIVVFTLTVFLLLLMVLKLTPLGLQMRAVTQNRRMASSMGIRTGFVDAMTFGLGSGVAGIAGVALSQIDNVSPNLGQGYIIDSFMVVVFGGVGNLWGTLISAFSLGIANKLLEPFAGAVLGKIAILVLLILFIQKRPRGLFALKGRAVES